MLCQTPQSNSAFSLGFWLSVQFDHCPLLLTHLLPWFRITFTPEFLTRLALTSPTPGWSHITSLIPNPATEYLLEPHSLQECPSLLPAKPLMFQGPPPVAFLSDPQAELLVPPGTPDHPSLWPNPKSAVLESGFFFPRLGASLGWSWGLSRVPILATGTELTAGWLFFSMSDSGKGSWMKLSKIG